MISQADFYDNVSNTRLDIKTQCRDASQPFTDRLEKIDTLLEGVEKKITELNLDLQREERALHTKYRFGSHAQYIEATRLVSLIQECRDLGVTIPNLFAQRRSARARKRLNTAGSTPLERMEDEYLRLETKTRGRHMSYHREHSLLHTQHAEKCSAIFGAAQLKLSGIAIH